MIGKTALALTASDTPPDIRSEAHWWANADGNRGTKIEYDGEENGIHWWKSGRCRMMLKSKPPHLTPEDVQRLEWRMKQYYERERERMIESFKQGRQL